MSSNAIQDLLQRVQDDVNKQAKAVAEKQAELDKVNEKLFSATREIEYLRTLNADCNTKIAEFKSAGVSPSEVADLKSKLATVNANATALTQKHSEVVASLKEECNEVYAKLTEQYEINSRDKELHDRELAVKVDQYIDLSQRLETSKKDVRTRNDQITDLTRQLTESKAKVAELEQIVARGKEYTEKAMVALGSLYASQRSSTKVDDESHDNIDASEAKPIEVKVTEVKVTEVKGAEVKTPDFKSQEKTSTYVVESSDDETDSDSDSDSDSDLPELEPATMTRPLTTYSYNSYALDSYPSTSSRVRCVNCGGFH